MEGCSGPRGEIGIRCQVQLDTVYPNSDLLNPLNEIERIKQFRLLLEAVADPVYGFDSLAQLMQLAPRSTDVNIHGAIHRVIVIAHSSFIRRSRVKTRPGALAKSVRSLNSVAVKFTSSSLLNT